MQHHWPDTHEEPTPKANLTIVELPFASDDPAYDEQPTPKANLTIKMVPSNIPSYAFRPGAGELAAANEHLEARGQTADAYLHACILWIARDPDTALATLTDHGWLSADLRRPRRRSRR